MVISNQSKGEIIMGRYILSRVVSAIITIWFIMTITFFLMHSIPGDPFGGEGNNSKVSPEIVKALNEKYGLDKPMYVQYITYMGNFLKGDFGLSFKKKGVTIVDIITAGLPYSGVIGIYSAGLVIFVGVLMGIIAALRQNKFSDRIIMVISTLGATIPGFVFATVFLYIFSKKLGVVPAFGVASWKGYIGPVICVGVFSLAFLARLTRTSILEVLQQDYVRTARAKGLSEFVVVGKHVLRNSLIPVVTYIGPMIAGIVTGSFVIEKVFGIPGIGYVFTNSILDRDYTIIMGMTVFLAILLVVSVLIVDIVYVLIDPRIKYD